MMDEGVACMPHADGAGHARLIVGSAALVNILVMMNDGKQERSNLLYLTPSTHRQYSCTYSVPTP